MYQSKNKKVDINPNEKSFSLLETILAMSILATVILEIGGAQGHMAYLSGYNRNLVQASWYAKRIMSQIENQASYMPFKTLETTKKKNNPVKSKGADTHFTYDIEITEWKFPLLEALFPKDQSGGSAGPSSEVIKAAVKQILGDDIIKIAHLEVFWPEGAKRNSITVTQLLTNQVSLNQHLSGMQRDYKKLLNEVNGVKDNKKLTEKECRDLGRRWDSKAKKCIKEPANQKPGTDENEQDDGNRG